MKRRILTAAAMGCLIAVNGPAGAEDIDLFLNPPQGVATTPNILFVIDNSANWGATQYRDGNNTAITKRDIIHQALYRVATSPDFTDAVNIGYMTFSTGDGGKVMSAVQPLTAAHQSELGQQIFGARIWQAGSGFSLGEYVVPSSPNGYYYQVVTGGLSGAEEPVWPIASGATVYGGPTDDTGAQTATGPVFKTIGKLDANVQKIPSYNNAPYALMMNEAYLYYMGAAPREGTSDGDHDPDAIGDGGNYLSPAADSCSNNFIILLGSGAPDSNENNPAEAALTSHGGKLKSDPIDGLKYEDEEPDYDNYAANWADEFARFLASSDVVDSKEGKQNIVTHVIKVVDKDAIQTKPDKAAMAFLANVADEGDGRHYFAKTVDDIVAAINDVLDKVKAESSVFASTTLPVSVNVRGTNLNQIYMGVFRPDEYGLPRWVGNLKLYELAVQGEELYLADSNGLQAEDTKNGFLVNEAVSYWTTDSTFWGFHGEYDPSDSPDGKIVEKGAVAQKLREAADRNVYTCTGGCGPADALASTPFDTSNDAITQALLAADSAAERDAIINWTRGQDLFDEDDDGDTTDTRASIHGDVLHSRPAVINYNRNAPTVVDGVAVQDENDIMAFYGANDGTIRAIYGGKGGDSFDGQEAWAFIPPEFFGELKTLYNNNDTTPITDEVNGYKPYFADGHIGVYLHDAEPKNSVYRVAEGDKVHLFISMRRGGRLLYALDVTDPDNPRLLWKRSSSDTGYGELGQTWSEPKVVRLNVNGTATDALVFGAGYDPDAEDTIAQGTATMGRGIFVVNAGSGDVIWQAGPSGTDSASFEPVADMTYPIPSNVTVLDTNSDGYEDRVYVGDTGGQMWRVNMGDPNPANWAVVKLATLADHSEAAGYRKFLYEPDVVYGTDFDYVLLGSGDREHPDDETVLNRFYMLKDRHSDTAITENDLYNATDNLIQDGTDAQKEAAAGELNVASGWYINLLPGEKVVSSAVTLAGSTFFNTNQPILNATNSCVSSLGTARNYIISYKDASATTELNYAEGLTKGDRFGDVAGGGFPPSPVPVIVEIDGKKYQAVVSGTKVLTPDDLELERRERAYWYRQNSD